MADMIRENRFLAGPAVLRAGLSALALAALAVVAWQAAPAGAVDGQPDNLARYSACVGPATAPAGFEDTGGSIAEAAIDCLVHYGVTKGRTADRFAPAETVARRQMALFLARAAGPAGIDLPAAPEEGFTDIADLSEEARVAIGQMAELGIMTGAAGLFNPHGPVTRGDMAVILDQFLRQAEVGPGGVDITDVDPDDTRFADIREAPLTVFRAVRNLAELGITGGTTPTAFSPEKPVTRAQMALFITRTLAHTNARPAGVTVQAVTLSVEGSENVETVASVRTADHQPQTRAPVDAFLAPRGEDSFNSRGECSVNNVTAAFGGSSTCRIDAGDPRTGRLGNITAMVEVSRTADLYAWTGQTGDRFGRESTPAGRLSFEAAQRGVDVKVSDDLPLRAQKIPFGQQVTFTFQMVDSDGDPVAEAGRVIRVATAIGQSSVGRDRVDSTNHSGWVRASFNQVDPNPTETGDQSQMRLVVTLPPGYGIRDDTTLGLDQAIVWADEEAVPSQLILSQQTVYQSASELNRGEENIITASLHDQYGAPLSGKRIEFWSDDPDGIGGERDEESSYNRRRRTTDREGVSTLRYTRDSANTGIERISAQYVVNPARASKDILAEPINHYWVLRAFSQDNGEPREYASLEVLYHDLERRAIVARSGGVLWLLIYGSGDQFVVDGSPVSMSRFRQVLNTPGYGTLTALITDRTSVADSVFTIGSPP